jgi:hypothetical protein
MIKIVQCRHGGFFFRLAWDPSISSLYNLAEGTNGRMDFDYQEFISIVH